MIHHGIDVGQFPVGAGSGGYLAALTRMSPVKGVDRAARLARLAGLPLKIAAKLREPHERDYFESCVRPHLGNGVEFVGELDGVAKRELLADATALVNPIDWDEPFGMTMLESLACGTPVITTPRGAATEIVDNGLTGFVAESDEDLIAGMRLAGELDRLRCRGHGGQPLLGRGDVCGLRRRLPSEDRTRAGQGDPMTRRRRAAPVRRRPRRRRDAVRWHVRR